MDRVGVLNERLVLHPLGDYLGWLKSTVCRPRCSFIETYKVELQVFSRRCGFLQWHCWRRWLVGRRHLIGREGTLLAISLLHPWEVVELFITSLIL